MASEEPITLKEVQLRLGVPQHVLIHLCEKGVISPDFADTAGRGKRREFSQRNLFEFAVALTLRDLELPVAIAALIVRLLRAFDRATTKLLPGFELPEFLLERGVDLSIHLYDARLVVVNARGGSLRKPLLLGVSLTDASKEPGARPRLERFGELPSEYDAHLDLDLTRIARRVLQGPLSK